MLTSWMCTKHWKEQLLVLMVHT